MALSSLSTVRSRAIARPDQSSTASSAEAVRLAPRPVRSFRRGQVIPLQPSQIWVVQEGIVLLNTLYPSGDEALLGLAGPSMPFGLPLSAVDPYQAVAFCEVEAVS